MNLRPTPPRPRRRGLLAACTCLLAALVACEHPNLVETTWANRARAGGSPDTPFDDPVDLRARYGPADDRDEDELADLDGDDEVGMVEMRLGTGVHQLRAPVTLLADEVLIAGDGPHKTSIDLDTDSRASLLIPRAKRVVIRDVTLIGLTGGGIRIRDCPDVRIENVHVAGAALGFDLQSSTASVGTSVFAGCHRALILDQATLTLRETAFVECWEGVSGHGVVDAESCAFVDGREGLPARLDRRSRVVSCLFGGERQSAGWDGRPSEARANLAGLQDLGDRLGPVTNRLIRKAEEFPRDLPQGLPPGFDLPGVHLTLERARRRGEKDPPAKLRGFAEDEAVDHAKLSRAALLGRRVEEAQREARWAVRYLGEVTQIPEEVAGIMDLAAE